MAAENISVECPELGMLHVDVAYGGNFYAIVDPQENFPDWSISGPNSSSRGRANYGSASMKNTSSFTAKNPTIRGLSHILWTGKPIDPASTARNAVYRRQGD
jgi:4-hydroxyproline epimerase